MALTLTVSCASVVSLISPWLAVWSPYALLGGRICTGLLEVRFVHELQVKYPHFVFS